MAEQRKTPPPPLPGLLGKKPAEPSVEGLAPALEALSRAVVRVASPQLEVTVENLPPPGVEELLAQQVAIIERTLVPLVKTSLEHLGEARAVEDKLDEVIGLLRQADAQIRD